MDIVYPFQGVEFEWDENKARSNVEDHGVTFEEAVEVFFDPFYQEGDASRDDEQRDFIMGYSL
ncbi:MAG: BrnT family toxin, partial [Candidatus Tectomicrobia bacterium]|nr:BrnT family toxin [Candidatus Tectomicrobia bacterium]